MCFFVDNSSIISNTTETTPVKDIKSPLLPHEPESSPTSLESKRPRLIEQYKQNSNFNLKMAEKLNLSITISADNIASCSYNIFEETDPPEANASIKSIQLNPMTENDEKPEDVSCLNTKKSSNRSTETVISDEETEDPTKLTQKSSSCDEIDLTQDSLEDEPMNNQETNSSKTDDDSMNMNSIQESLDKAQQLLNEMRNKSPEPMNGTSIEESVIILCSDDDSDNEGARPKETREFPIYFRGDSEDRQVEQVNVEDLPISDESNVNEETSSRVSPIIQFPRDSEESQEQANIADVPASDLKTNIEPRPTKFSLTIGEQSKERLVEKINLDDVLDFADKLKSSYEEVEMFSESEDDVEFVSFSPAKDTCNLLNDDIDMKDLEGRIFTQFSPQPSQSTQQESPTSQIELSSSSLNHSQTIPTSHPVLQSADFNQDQLVIRTESVTPPPDYTSLSPAAIEKELRKFGIKKLKGKKALTILQHIYNQLHPEIECTEEEFNSLNTDNINETIQDLEQQLGVERFVPEDIQPEQLQPKTKTRQVRVKKVPTCALPIEIAFQNFLQFNPAFHERVLQYIPIDLEELLKDFKSIGVKYDSKEVIAYLDLQCITYRIKDKRKMPS